MIDRTLDKLAPLMPERVKRWRRALTLVDRDLRELLEKEIIATGYSILGDQREQILLSLPPAEKAKGVIDLGTILYNEEKWSAGLQKKELMQNLAVFGRSGAGKTNVVFHLLEQLVTERIPFLFLDWKRTGRHLLPRLGRKARVFTPGRNLSRFPFNPFVAPPGIEQSVYLNHVVDVLGDAYTLGDAARSVLHKALGTIDGTPTVEKITNAVNNIPDQERVRGWKTSALRALESVAALKLDDHNKKEMETALCSGSAIIELDGLAPSNKKFLLPLLCLWIYYLKLPTAKREELSLVIVVEEAHHLLYRKTSGSESLMEQLLRQCREIGIGVIVVDQHPHLISSAALGNTYTTICLNLKDPTDMNKAANVTLVGNKEIFSRLPVGHGVVKLQDRWTNPFLVRFPLVTVAKGAVTDDVLRRHIRPDGTLSGAVGALAGLSSGEGRSRNADRPLTEEELLFVDDVLQHPDDGVDARYKRLGINTDKGHKRKRKLISKGTLEEKTIKIGRTTRVVLRVSKNAREMLGLETTTGNESLDHEYWKRWHANKLDRAGYQVQIEAPRNQGHADIVGWKNGETIAIEIETGKSDTLTNVRQDLLSGFGRVIVVGTNKKAHRRIEKELAGAGLISPRVRVMLRDNT